MVGVRCRERQVCVIGSYIMLLSTLLLLALSPCFNTAGAGVANGCGWASWAEAVESAHCHWVGTCGWGNGHYGR